MSTEMDQSGNGITLGWTVLSDLYNMEASGLEDKEQRAFCVCFGWEKGKVHMYRK